MNKKETIKSVLHLAKSVYPYFDKIIFKADSDVSFLNTKKLSNPNPHPDPKKNWKPARILKTDTKFTQAPYEIRLYQPTCANMEYLITATADEPVLIYASSAEVTYDFIGSNHIELSNLIARHLVITKTHAPYYKNDRGTHYFGYRKKNVSKMFPVLYADRLSKITGENCAHFEFKLFGKEKCDEYLLSSPNDFLQFDFGSFFSANTKFYLPPSKTVLGQFMDYNLDQTCNTARSQQKLFDRVAESDFLLTLNDPLQKMLQALPDLRKFYSSRPMQAKNKKFTADFQEALLHNIKPY